MSRTDGTTYTAISTIDRSNYDENENWIARPELLTKTYEKIARRARKLAQKII